MVAEMSNSKPSRGDEAANLPRTFKYLLGLYHADDSGSLVVRLVFLPFEESAYATFARFASFEDIFFAQQLNYVLYPSSLPRFPSVDACPRAANFCYFQWNFNVGVFTYNMLYINLIEFHVEERLVPEDAGHQQFYHPDYFTAGEWKEGPATIS
ncbi:RFT1 [Forsythia ovata]|uniref:Protein RFT1 homolog n=1 Tax=Forsythia ovata TaxID=205694 RepID=A0ABD1WP14_9LAMI